MWIFFVEQCWNLEGQVGYYKMNGECQDLLDNFWGAWASGYSNPSVYFHNYYE